MPQALAGESRIQDIQSRLPNIDATLALEIANMVAHVRKEELRKSPGVAETLDWAATLAGLNIRHLRDEPEAVFDTLMCLIKTAEDKSRMSREVVDRLVGKVA